MFKTSNIDHVRAAVAQLVTCSLDELHAAIGRLVVIDSSQVPAGMPLGDANRSVFDSATRTTMLLADRIPDNKVAQAVAGELVRLHGRDAAAVALNDAINWAQPSLKEAVSGIFEPKYGRFPERAGTPFTLIGKADETTYFRIRFDDGLEYFAWPEEINEGIKNVVGHIAVPPFYIWSNEDSQNKCDDLQGAKEIRIQLINEGHESVYIVDGDGVEVVDPEIEAHEVLVNHGFFAGARRPEVKPEFPGKFMVNDPDDPDGYALVGDNIGELIVEARDHLIDIPPVIVPPEHSHDGQAVASDLEKTHRVKAEAARYTVHAPDAAEPEMGFQYCLDGTYSGDYPTETAAWSAAYAELIEQQGYALEALSKALMQCAESNLFEELATTVRSSAIDQFRGGVDAYERQVRAKDLTLAVAQGWPLVDIPAGQLLSHGWSVADDYTKDLFPGAEYMRRVGGFGTPFATYDFTIVQAETDRWIPVHGGVKMPPVASPEAASKVLCEYWNSRAIALVAGNFGRSEFRGTENSHEAQGPGM